MAATPPCTESTTQLFAKLEMKGKSWILLPPATLCPIRYGVCGTHSKEASGTGLSGLAVLTGYHLCQERMISHEFLGTGIEEQVMDNGLKMLFSSQERGTLGIVIVPRTLWVLVPTRMVLAIHQWLVSPNIRDLCPRRSEVSSPTSMASSLIKANIPIKNFLFGKKET